ncbi:MAG TPA: hypothetical protein VJJ27_00920 [Candidatus Paceibacterota bacterium]
MAAKRRTEWGAVPRPRDTTFWILRAMGVFGCRGLQPRGWFSMSQLT